MVEKMYGITLAPRPKQEPPLRHREGLVTQEYAGFLYAIYEKDGRLVAEPFPGQHRAANKDKHRRAALEMYNAR